MSKKIAQLHDGSQIEFPPETPDHEIDAHVRNHMGLPPDVHPAVQQQATMEALNAIMGLQQMLITLVQTMQQFVQQNAVTTQAIAQLPQLLAPLQGLPQTVAAVHQQGAAMHTQSTAQLQKVSDAIVASNHRVADAHDNLAAVQASPREFIMKGDKPVGFKLANPKTKQ